jgi:enoyl-CoA hydratase/carnithine racemase
MSEPSSTANASAPPSDRITREVRGHVMLIGFNRAKKKNAFDLEMLDALSLAVTELDRDPELRAGVIFAHGTDFTAGLDLGNVAPAIASGERSLFKPGTVDPWATHGPACRKPIVTAAQGLCLTLGIELMLATDVRLAASDARFGQIEVKRGIFPFGGATARWVSNVGWGNAQRYLLTGDMFGAEEALRIGLVQEVVAPDRLVARAIEIAETIAAQAPLAVQASLASSRRAVAEGEAAAAAALLPELRPLMQSEDAAEGLASFLERRPAKFKGR